MRIVAHLLRARSDCDVIIERVAPVADSDRPGVGAATIAFLWRNGRTAAGDRCDRCVVSRTRRGSCFGPGSRLSSPASNVFVHGRLLVLAGPAAVNHCVADLIVSGASSFRRGRGRPGRL